MPILSLVRVAEPWTIGGVIAFIVLAIALGVGIATIIGRIGD
jgi:hypothetical protein